MAGQGYRDEARRSRGAAIARKFPIVFGMLERRELHLSAICEVREFLTIENHGELLEEISRRTKLEIREILARRFPQADVPTSLKKLPTLEPLSPGRYRLLLTLSAEQKQKLELARDLLSHANPTGDFAVVVERALDELIAGLERRRFGQSRAQKPKPTRQAPADGNESPKVTPGRRRIRQAVRRELLARDGASCTFVDRDGERCSGRAFK